MSKQAQPGAGNGDAHDGQDAAPVQDGKGNVGKVFSRPFVFLRGVPSLDFLPPEGPPEVAFAGRSNVGKSSLINALVGQKALARTSNTPGRTQELNFFAPDGYSGTPDDLPPFAIVDMPGYGFAQAPKEKVDQWTELVFDYLRGRSTLKRVFLLIDSRHGIKTRDEEVLALLDAAAVSYQLVLTKTDKLKGHALARTIETAEKAVQRRPAAFPGTLSTSSQKNAGLDDLRHAILAAAGLTVAAQQEN